MDPFGAALVRDGPSAPCFRFGFSFARIVARASHWASFSSCPSFVSSILGKSAGIFTELPRELFRRWSSEDNRLSDRPSLEDTDALEELRKRKGRLLGLGLSTLREGLRSDGGDRGVIISWVLVSVRINVNSGEEPSAALEEP